MQTLSRSWNLAKITFRVIGQDKELLLFPLVAMVLSAAYLVALLYPTIWLEISRDDSMEWDVADYVVTFIAYLGLAFIGTFSNMCIVYTAKKRFAGGDATFGESIGFAMRRVHQVLAWAAVSATVGVLLRVIDDAAERAGSVGQVVVGILRSLLGMLWSAITLFVIPSMVYRATGPVAAIKDSIRVLKQTWGESLVRAIGFGLVEFLFFLGGVAAFGGLLVAAASTDASSPVLLGITVLALVYFVCVTFVFMLARVIFNTALYLYASEGTLAPGYDNETLRAAFRTK